MSPAIILGTGTIKAKLANSGRSIIYTTALSFIAAAGVRAGYSVLKSGQTDEVEPSSQRKCDVLLTYLQARNRVQEILRLLFAILISYPVWEVAVEKHIFSIPLT